MEQMSLVVSKEHFLNQTDRTSSRHCNIVITCYDVVRIICGLDHHPLALHVNMWPCNIYLYQVCAGFELMTFTFNGSDSITVYACLYMHFIFFRSVFGVDSHSVTQLISVCMCVCTFHLYQGFSNQASELRSVF